MASSIDSRKMAAFLLLFAACSDDGANAFFSAGNYTESGPLAGSDTGTLTTAVPTGGPDSGPGSGDAATADSTGAPSDDTTGPGVDASTGGTSIGDASTGDASTGNASTGDTASSEGSSTGPAAVCGDGVAEDGEPCDGADLVGQDCGSQGFDAGTLACAGDCSDFDTTGCVTFVCGNGIIEGTEDCDGADLGGADCLSAGFDAGTLACADCAFDTAGCSSFMCGDGVIEGDEVCDGADLAGQSCASLDFDAGTLACAGDCGSYDTTGCIQFSCGNGVIEGAEQCDGAALDSATCATLGHDDGTLACSASCTYDESGCTDFAGDCCTAHANPGCDDAACTASVCAVNAFCCNAEWDALCASFAFNMCPAICDNCGDGVVNGPNEVCDGGDVAGDTCQAQGFDGGTLGCATDCTALDTSGCFNYSGACCAANGTPGCDDPTCTDDVCAIDPTCCTGAWDAACAAEAANVCPVECNACVEQGLGSATGAPVVFGTTAGEDEDFVQTCVGAAGNGGAVDRVLSWTAPNAGTWTFDLVGSSYDTVLSIYSSCDPGDELACNDDFANNPLCGGFECSQIDLPLAAGQSVLIAVSGYDGATGSFQLRINQFGDCCTSHNSPGCVDPTCEAAICGEDDFCCTMSWDGLCSDAALVSPACVGADYSCPN